MDHKNKQIKRFLSQKGNGGLTKSNGFSASGLVTEPSRGTFLSGGVLSELFSTLIYHRTLSGRNISGGKYLTEHSVVKANLSFLCSIKCSLPNPLKLNFVQLLKIVLIMQPLRDPDQNHPASCFQVPGP